VVEGSGPLVASALFIVLLHSSKVRAFLAQNLSLGPRISSPVTPPWNQADNLFTSSMASRCGFSFVSFVVLFAKCVRL